jgi:hypothetical protein
MTKIKMAGLWLLRPCMGLEALGHEAYTSPPLRLSCPKCTTPPNLTSPYPTPPPFTTLPHPPYITPSLGMGDPGDDGPLPITITVLRKILQVLLNIMLALPIQIFHNTVVFFSSLVFSLQQDR